MERGDIDLSEIDNRVVQMQFDNAQFERNCSQSISTLDKLKKALKLPGANKDLDNVSNSAKNLNNSGLSGLQATLQGISDRFSNLGIVGITILQNITNQAIATGTQLLKSLTIQPAIDGLREYETQINSVQTILANTQHEGTNIDQVNAALDELNAYADKTIYNFSEMTRNIGTFTAAGVDLETSVSSIQGIANLAAVSGSTSAQASTAMYQLSQALAAGKVSLMDWNSVVNAGMGGKVFQDALIRTSELLGTGAEEAIAKYGSFRESLTQGEWLTTEVLTRTLEQFALNVDTAEDYQAAIQDLMAQGYTEQQATEIADMARTASDAATKVKTFSQLIDTLKEALGSGWAQTWRTVIGDFEQAKELWTNVSNVLGGMIQESADARNAIVSEWAEMGGRDQLIQGLANAFDALLSVIKPIKQAFENIFPPVTAQQLYDLTEGFQNFTKSLILNEDAQKALQGVAEGVFSVIKIGVNVIGAFVTGLGKVVGAIAPVVGGLFSVTGGIGSFVSSLSLADNAGRIVTETFDMIAGGIQTVVTWVQSLANDAQPALQSFVDFIKSGFSGIADFINQALGNVDTGEATGLFAMLLSGELLHNISGFIKSFGGVADTISGFGDAFKTILSDVSDAIQAYQQNVKADTLQKIAVSLGILAASLLVLSSIEPSRMVSSLGAMTVMFGELAAVMYVMDQAMGGLKGGNIVKATAYLIGISGAMLILSAAVKVFSTMDLPGLGKGLIGVAGAMTILVVALNKIDMGKIKASNGVAILAIATSMVILAEACSKFAQIKASSLVKALGAIGILLTELGVFVNNTGNASKVISTSTGLVVLSGAMIVLSVACEKFAAIKSTSLAKSLLAIGAALAEMTIALNMLPKDTASKAAGLLVISTAMVVLAKAVSGLAGMSWEEIGRGLVAMAGALTILSVALAAISKTQKAAPAMVAMAGAVMILAPAMKLLGSLSLEQVGTALLALAGAFTVLGVAGAVLSPIVGPITLLAGAITLLGVAVLAAGVGIAAFGVGITALAASGTAGIAALSGAIMIIVNLIPQIATSIGQGLINIVQVIGQNAVVIMQTFTQIVTAICQGVITAAPQVGEAVLVLITTFCNTVIAAVPQLVTTGFTVLMSFLNGIAANIGQITITVSNIIVNFINALALQLPVIIEAGFNFIISFINGLATAVSTQGPALGTAFLNLFMSIITTVVGFLGSAIPTLLTKGVELIGGLANGIWSAAGQVWNFVTNIVSTAVGKVGEFFGSILTKGGELISNLANGIWGMAQDVWNNIGNIVSGGVDKVGEFVSSIFDAGANLVQGLIDGIASLAGSVTDAIGGLVNDAIEFGKGLLGIESPSKVFAEIGRYVDLGFAKGLRDYAYISSNAAAAMAQDSVDSAKHTFKNLRNLDLLPDSTPVIRPILDLTDIKQGVKEIGNQFAGNHLLKVDTSLVNSAKASIDGYSRVAPNTVQGQNVTTVNMTQNNYSPKALSRIDIYRDTRNQLSLAREALSK